MFSFVRSLTESRLRSVSLYSYANRYKKASFALKTKKQRHSAARFGRLITTRMIDTSSYREVVQSSSQCGVILDIHSRALFTVVIQVVVDCQVDCSSCVDLDASPHYHKK